MNLTSFRTNGAYEYIKDHGATKTRFEVDQHLLQAGYSVEEIESARQSVAAGPVATPNSSRYVAYAQLFTIVVILALISAVGLVKIVNQDWLEAFQSSVYSPLLFCSFVWWVIIMAVGFTSPQVEWRDWRWLILKAGLLGAIAVFFFTLM